MAQKKSKTTKYSKAIRNSKIYNGLEGGRTLWLFTSGLFLALLDLKLAAYNGYFKPNYCSLDFGGWSGGHNFKANTLSTIVFTLCIVVALGLSLSLIKTHDDAHNTRVWRVLLGVCIVSCVVIFANVSGLCFGSILLSQ